MRTASLQSPLVDKVIVACNIIMVLRNDYTAQKTIIEEEEEGMETTPCWYVA
jgi:hypothetical protein